MEKYIEVQNSPKPINVICKDEDNRIEIPNEVGGNQKNYQNFPQNNQQNFPQNNQMMNQQMMNNGMMYQQVPQSRMILPDGYNLLNFQPTTLKDPFTILSETDSVVIKQEMNIFEILTGCEVKNRYDVYVLYNGMTIRLFRCKEQSGWCMRNCCHPSCRSFVMSVKYVGNLTVNIDDDFTAPIAIINRPYACTCYCLARPEMNVTWNANNIERNIGTVKHPCTCLDYVFNIYNSRGDHVYKLNVGYCQKGICCGNMGRCYEVTIDIFRLVETEEPCGKIIKIAKCSSCVTNADTFNIFYPKDATPEEKMLIISATLMIDYTFFEDNGNNLNNGGDGISNLAFNF